METFSHRESFEWAEFCVHTILAFFFSQFRILELCNIIRSEANKSCARFGCVICLLNHLHFAHFYQFIRQFLWTSVLKRLKFRVLNVYKFMLCHGNISILSINMELRPIGWTYIFSLLFTVFKLCSEIFQQLLFALNNKRSSSPLTSTST